MKPTYEEAANAAKIVRQYMNGEKKCYYTYGKEADEISRCSVILQNWTKDGCPMQEVNKEFIDEFHYAHRISVSNAHMEEAHIGEL